MIQTYEIRTHSCLDVLQRDVVVALDMCRFEVPDGQQEHHRPTTAVQLSTLALRLSHTLPTITKHHPSTPPPFQTRDTTIKVTNTIKAILEVNSKVWNCSLPKMHGNEVERLFTSLLQVLHLEQRGWMELSDDHRRMQG